jgi:hypothetical protein
MSTNDEAGFEFDPNVVSQVVAQHGYKLVSREMTSTALVVNVMALLVVLFMMIELRGHLVKYSKK